VTTNLDQRKKNFDHWPASGWTGGWLGGIVATALLCRVAVGAELVSKTESNFADLSLEELMNVSVTSVSKRETKLEDAPSAIFVITGEDLRRTGATSIPEALRMVPGMQVGRINANEWAVTARGFNSQYANKLLVLVDGRTVYTPSFSGVFWHNQDLMLEDLDRIEIIRGPGATLWGANAVNGVINVISKSAKDTPGWLASTTLGTEFQPLANLRYGGQLGGNLFYRVYGQFLNHTDFVQPSGNDAADEWHSLRTGARLDWHPSEGDQFTLQGDYGQATVNQTHDVALLVPVATVETRNTKNQNHAANVLGRWTRSLSAESEFSLQVYYDTFEHNNSETEEQRDTFDFDWQHRLPLFARHDVMWGLGYRYSPAHTTPSDAISWFPERTDDQLFSAFVQDEVALVEEKLSLTLGSKFEHNDYTGFEYQPSGRLRWTATEHQTLWAAVSRAVRTPSRLEESIRSRLSAMQPPLSPPVEISTIPARNVESEELLAFELGYRLEPTQRLSFDVAGYFNLYDNVVFYHQGPPEFEPDPAPGHLLVPLEPRWNDHGVGYGVELLAEWRVTDSWKLAGGYTWSQTRLHLNGNDGRENPEHQFQLRSYLNVTKDLELNAAAYFVDAIQTPLSQGLMQHASYVRLDLGLAWRPHQQLELSVWGQNLMDDRHSEFSSFQTSTATEVPRGLFGKITWRF
jgi:iron complex outermembrane receptor protein